MRIHLEIIESEFCSRSKKFTDYNKKNYANNQLNVKCIEKSKTADINCNLSQFYKIFTQKTLEIFLEIER